MEGWIKLHRGMLDWEWFTQPKTLSVFIYLLLSARHDDGCWRGVELKTGECIISREKIAQATGLSQQEVRTSIKRLENTGEITSRATNKYTIVTITNYASYQSVEEDMQPANQPASQPINNQQITNNQPTNNQQITTNKNNKNVKNNKNDKNIDIPPYNSPKSDKYSMKNQLISDGLSEELVDAYMRVRKSKKAPDSQVAYNGLKREAEKAGVSMEEAITECVERNWVGFKADWYFRDHKRTNTTSLNLFMSPMIDPETEKQLRKRKAEREEQERLEIEAAKQRDRQRIEDIIYHRK